MANYIINVFCVYDIAVNGYYIFSSAPAYGHVHIIPFAYQKLILRR